MKPGLLLLLSFATTATAAQATSVCVANGSDTRLFFVAEARDGTRQAGWLAPAETLCSTGAQAGVVSVFESEDDLEGCSRLAAAGATETLLHYTAFDRCAWASNSN